MEKLIDYINEWKEELLSPAINDALVNIIPNKNAVHISECFKNEKLSIPQSKDLKKITSQALKIKRQSGVQSLGLSHNYITYELENKQFKCPLVIQNISWKLNRLNSTYEFKIVGEPYVNPFLIKTLGHNFQEADSEKIIEEIKSLGLKFESVQKTFIANFHPHRYILIKEIESLEKVCNSQIDKMPLTVKILFENQKNFDDRNLHLSDISLLPTDHRQNQVFKNLNDKNLIIDGPPGTGKSDVLTNIVAKTLHKGKTCACIAENKTALEVIENKLKSFGLHRLTLKLHQAITNKEFVYNLKETWQYFEEYKPRQRQQAYRSVHLINKLQMQLDKLNSDHLFGGVSFEEFNFENVKNSAKYLPDCPTITTWKKDKKLLLKTDYFENEDEINAVWLNIKESFIKDIDRSFNAIENQLNWLAKENLESLNYKTFKEKLKLSLFAHNFFWSDNLLNKKLFDVNSKTHKKFNKLFNNYQTLTQKIELLKPEEENWKKQLNLTELLSFLKVVNAKDNFSLKNWLRKRRIKNLGTLDFQDTKLALENLLKLKETEQELIEVKSEIRALNLPDNVVELQQIKALIDRVTNTKESEFNDVFNLKDHEITKLYKQYDNLDNFLRFLKHFNLQEDTNCYDWLKTISKHKKQIVSNRWLIENISDETKNILSKERGKLEEVEQVIYSSHYFNLKGRFPELAKLTESKLKSIVEDITKSIKIDARVMSEDILSQTKYNFEKANKLLSTPASKLSKDEKALKKRLRKGKSILVKEFSKSRQHKSPIELMESEAVEWIKLLKPVYLTSSTSLAKNIPFKPEILDIVVFDEASQMPLSHSIGGVYRAKRIAIAGDEQQMPPASNFTYRASIDLLSYAKYYLKNQKLRFHYRSINQKLIEYSNNYFYNKELTVFPEYQVSDSGIEVVNLKGIYENRVNIEEAKYVAKLIQKQLDTKDFDFGVVAFSSKQLEAILSELKADDLIKLNENEDTILISSLENVQGEQCEHLIISSGYAKNEEGKFHHRFGPLNEQNGHRRLNVLMSRAKKKITFVRSITEEDFKISSNEGVEHFRKLMLFLSKQEKNQDKEIPFNATLNKNEIWFRNINKEFPYAYDFVTVFNVLKNRGWKLRYSIFDKVSK